MGLTKKLELPEPRENTDVHIVDPEDVPRKTYLTRVVGSDPGQFRYQKSGSENSILNIDGGFPN